MTAADPPVAAVLIDDADRALRSSMLRLRARAPFFGTLALYARFVATDTIPTAATDGQDVYYNPEFMLSLAPAHLDGVLVHEVLHAALDHVFRRGSRDAMRWNQSADIVVNGLIIDAGMSLPDSALRDSTLERFSVEEVYALMSRDGDKHEEVELDLLPSLADGKADRDGEGTRQPGGITGQARQDKVRRQWAEAIDRAASVTRGREHGNLPAGLERAFGLLQRPRLDWRTLLWRFLARAPTDFATFDRRFVHQGLYLETLEAVSLRVVVGIDTSGSIDQESLEHFLAELHGILRAYPATQAWLFYVDTVAYGPFPIVAGDELPSPMGGGGTEFAPFFDAVDDAGLVADGTVAVYLTDGEGPFPSEAPDYPVLWIVTPGGIDEDLFPFGDVVRMS
jgi:predicted metal-dependent peptidase